jgi:hypothetical protein
LQGLASAASMSSALGILGQTFKPGKYKNYAFAVYGAGAPLGKLTPWRTRSGTSCWEMGPNQNRQCLRQHHRRSDRRVDHMEMYVKKDDSGMRISIDVFEQGLSG